MQSYLTCKQKINYQEAKMEFGRSTGNMGYKRKGPHLWKFGNVKIKKIFKNKVKLINLEQNCIYIIQLRKVRRI